MFMNNQASNRIDIGGQIGYWQILSKAPGRSSVSRYLCRCACGTERTVAASSLRKGVSMSCGCIPKRVNKSALYDVRPTPPAIQEIYQLIRQGYLPPADQFSQHDGAPTWSLDSIAKIFGVSREDIVASLRNSGERFSDEYSAAAQSMRLVSEDGIH